MRRKLCLFDLGHFLFLLLPLCGFNGQESVCYVFVTLPTVTLNYYKVLDLLNRKAQVNILCISWIKAVASHPCLKEDKTNEVQFALQSLQPCISFQSWFGDNYVLHFREIFRWNPSWNVLILYTSYFIYSRFWIPNLFFPKMYPLNNTFKDAVVLNSNGTTK